MPSTRLTSCGITLVIVVLVPIILLRLVSRSLIYPRSPVACPADLETRLPGARLLR
jgi:hypothetical protein